MASPLTVSEVQLIAHFGFGARLDDVVVATLAYQRARQDHDRAVRIAGEALEVLQVTQEQAAKLPESLELPAVAERGHADAERQLESCERTMRSRSEAFFDVAGAGAGALLSCMEDAEFALDRTKLLAALSARAGA